MRSPEARVTVSGEVDKAAISSLALLPKKGEIFDSERSISVVLDDVPVQRCWDNGLIDGGKAIEVYLDQKSREKVIF